MWSFSKYHCDLNNCAKNHTEENFKPDIFLEKETSIFEMYMMWFVYFELEVKVWNSTVYGKPVHLKEGVYYSARVVLSQLLSY